MYLYNILFFVLFCFQVISLSAQCQYKPDYNTVEARRTLYDEKVGFIYENDLETPPYADWLKVGFAVHIVGNSATNEEVNEGIEILKTGFQQVKIQFYEVFRQNIPDPDGIYNSSTISKENNLAENHNIDKAVNIYYVADVDAGKGVGTFSVQQRNWYNTIIENGCQRTSDYIMVKGAHASETTLAHEMGHYFDLFHVYEASFLGSDETWNYATWDYGDLCPDTPSAKENVSYDCSNTDIITKNFMRSSWGEDEQCRSMFTDNQKGRMRYCLLNRRELYLRDAITLTNLIEQGNSSGQLSAYQNGLNQIVESGEEVALLNLNTNIKTLQERIYNWNGTSRNKFYSSTIS